MMAAPKKPTKRELAVAEVLRSLESLGFIPAGETQTETVRVPTSDSPVYGHGGSSGGELRTFGGRARFHLPGTTLYVTVGKITTFVYRLLPPKDPHVSQPLTKSNRAKPSTVGSGLGQYNTTQHETIHAALVLAKYESL